MEGQRSTHRAEGENEDRARVYRKKEKATTHEPTEEELSHHGQIHHPQCDACPCPCSALLPVKLPRDILDGSQFESALLACELVGAVD